MAYPEAGAESRRPGWIAEFVAWFFDWVKAHPFQAGTYFFAALYMLLTPILGLNLFLEAQKLVCGVVGPRLGCPAVALRDPGQDIPRRVVYERQLQNFKIANEDGDLKFLQGLERSGFRIEGADACQVLDSLVVRSASREILDPVKTIIVQSAGSAWTCANKGLIPTEGKESLAFDRALLDAAISTGLEGEKSMGACNPAGIVERFHRLSSVIDAYVSVHGMSDDFRQGVADYGALLDQLGRTDRMSAVQACTAVLFENADFSRYRVTRFVNGCHAIDIRLMRELSEERWMATADTQSIGKGGYVVRQFRELCSKWVPEGRWHIDFADIKSGLASWASR